MDKPCMHCSRDGVVTLHVCSPALRWHQNSVTFYGAPLAASRSCRHWKIQLRLPTLGNELRPYELCIFSHPPTLPLRRCRSPLPHGPMVPALNKAVRVGACNSWSLLRPPSLRATGQNRVSIPPCPTSHREPLSSFSSLASKRVRSSPLKRPATLSRTVRNPSQFRHCSTHRRMCRDQGDIGGSMAAAGREVLPANVKAAHYDLTLEPDFKEFTFEGSVRIE